MFTDVVTSEQGIAVMDGNILLMKYRQLKPGFVVHVMWIPFREDLLLHVFLFRTLTRLDENERNH